MKTKRADLWELRYKQVWDLVEKNHRGPSRHRIEEHQLLNWVKFNRKNIKNQKIDTIRKEKFERLIEFIHSFNRVNQYK